MQPRAFPVSALSDVLSRIPVDENPGSRIIFHVFSRNPLIFISLCSTYRLMKRPNPQIHFVNNHYRQHSCITSIIFPIQNAILWNYPYWYVPAYQTFFSVRNRFFPGMKYLLVWTTVPVDVFLFTALYHPSRKSLNFYIFGIILSPCQQLHMNQWHCEKKSIGLDLLQKNLSDDILTGRR